MEKRKERRPNIILLMTDQHRADHVGWAGDPRVATPALDRIAEGTAFRRCLTANPICAPARAALLTGRYSRQVNMLSMSGDLSRGIPTYPAALREAGYRTAGIGKFHWLQTWPWGTPRGRGLNLTRLRGAMKDYGFDHVWEVSGKQLAVRNYCDYAAHLDGKGLLDAYRDHVESRGANHFAAADVEFTGEPWPFSDEDYPDILTTDHMVRWIRGCPRGDDTPPFFMLGSWVSPHPPLDPPLRYMESVPYEEIDDFVRAPDEPEMDGPTKKRMWKLRRAYKAMVRMIDDQAARVFSALEQTGRLDDTVILFVSDHGEMLGDHGRFQKGVHWHQSALVPCAVRHPDHLDRRRVDTPVELTDLTATILDLAGLDPARALSRSWPAFADRIPGRSLLPVIRGETGRVRDLAFCEFNGEWSLLHSDHYAYVRFHTVAPDQPEEMLFDCRKDPDETRNLAPDPSFSHVLDGFRARLFHTLERYPPVQTRWAEDALM